MNKIQPLVDPFIPLQKDPQRHDLIQSQYDGRRLKNIYLNHSDSGSVTDRQATNHKFNKPRGATINDSTIQVALRHTKPQIANTPSHDTNLSLNPGQTAVKLQYRLHIRKLQLPLLIIGVLALGLLLQSLVVGEVMIALYGIYAIFWRIPSRTTYLLSLIITIGITVLYLIHSNGYLTADFAVYLILLFIIGTISLGLEVRVDHDFR